MKNKIIDHIDKLNRFALKLTRDKYLANDLVQETLCKALEKFDKFNHSNLGAWLSTIMYNSFVNDYRRNKHVDKTDFFIDDLSKLKNLSDLSTDSLILMNEIKAATQKIKGCKYEYLKMHMNGFKYREIAEHFQVPIGTVKSKIFFARKEFLEFYK